MSARFLKVVLLCGRGGPSHAVLRSLSAMGAKTYLICDNRSAIRFSRLCERVVFASRDIASEPPGTVAAVINGVHAEEAIDLVLGGDVASLVTIARMRDQLRPAVFPMPSLETLLRLHNKWEFHNLCVDCGVAVPRTLHLTYPDRFDPDEVVESFGLPLVVKPLASSGGDAVSIIHDRAGLLARIRDPEQQEDAGVLVQEYVAGSDWGLSVIARAGRVETWSTFACGNRWATEFCEQEELLDMGRRVVAATGYTGVANFDARLDGQSRIKLLECNPRFFHRVSATRLCGLDFVKAGIEGTPGSLTRGGYYPRGDLLSWTGWKRLADGQWPLSVAVRDMVELLIDPAPPIVRQLGILQRLLLPFLAASADRLAKI